MKKKDGRPAVWAVAMIALLVGGFDCGGARESPGLVCGDGEVGANERCDGAALRGMTCESLGFGPGELACASNCWAFDTRGCAAPASCGDGLRQEPEACDGADLAGWTCEALGFERGELRCREDCGDLDTSACVERCAPDCEGRTCGLDPVCNVSCGSCNGTCTFGQCVGAPDAGSMDAATGPCADIACSGNGVCVVIDDAPRCACDPGYVAVGLSCRRE